MESFSPLPDVSKNRAHMLIKARLYLSKTKILCEMAFNPFIQDFSSDFQRTLSIDEKFDIYIRNRSFLLTVNAN